MTSTDRGLLAKKYFLDGFNCSQAVALAFEDVIGLDSKTILKMSSAFGGGMGRLREVCGAVSGIFLVLGFVRGYDEGSDYEGKKRLYSEVQTLASTFQDKYGSIVCRDLLAGVSVSAGSSPEQIEYAARILHEFLEENGEI